MNVKQETSTTVRQTTPVSIGPEFEIGGHAVVMIPGPCSVESVEQTYAIARAIHEAGGRMIRGGAFKPRTSPHSFQGLGIDGLKILREAADEFGLLVVTEALGVEHIDVVAGYADMIQIGSRNMQHFPLLWAVGETDKPVMLKRGYMSTIDEWLLAVEHITQRGNDQIVLCERGIRGFDSSTRNVLDTSAIALIKATTSFPVLGDPSHATGRADLVIPAARAAVAAGADGLLAEFHPDPAVALSDGEQALPVSMMPELFKAAGAIASALGRSLA